MNGFLNYSFLKYIEMNELDHRHRDCEPTKSIQSVKNSRLHGQSDGAESTGKRKLRTIFKASGIDFRHSVLEDYGLEKDFTFYSNAADFEPFPIYSQTLPVFSRKRLEVKCSGC